MELMEARKSKAPTNGANHSDGGGLQSPVNRAGYNGRTLE